MNTVSLKLNEEVSVPVSVDTRDDGFAIKMDMQGHEVEFCFDVEKSKLTFKNDLFYKVQVDPVSHETSLECSAPYILAMGIALLGYTMTSNGFLNGLEIEHTSDAGRNRSVHLN